MTIIIMMFSSFSDLYIEILKKYSEVVQLEAGFYGLFKCQRFVEREKKKESLALR